MVSLVHGLAMGLLMAPHGPSAERSQLRPQLESTKSTLGKCRSHSSHPPETGHIPSSTSHAYELESSKLLAHRCGIRAAHAEYAQLQQKPYKVINFLGHGSIIFVEEVCVTDAAQPVHLMRKGGQTVHLIISEKESQFRLGQSPQCLKNRPCNVDECRHKFCDPLYGDFAELDCRHACQDNSERNGCTAICCDVS